MSLELSSNPLTDKRLKNDNVLQKIIKDFVVPNDNPRREHNIIVEELKKEFISRLKSTDLNFSACRPHILPCGSYFKKTKVEKLDEYDLNIVLNLPLDYKKCKVFVNASEPCYVQIDISEAYTDKWHSTTLQKLIVDPSTHCLNRDKFNRWIESMISKSFPSLTQIKINDSIIVKIRFEKHGPAQTMNVFRNEMSIMTIDFVPCLEFSNNLPNFFTFKEKDTMAWYAIPKPVHYGNNNNLMWRTSFYRYEAEILRRSVGSVKQVIRLMKKMRTNLGCIKLIPSYYIETIFYNEILHAKTNFEGRSLVQMFVYMLNVFKQKLEAKRIPFAWNQNYNLLQNHKEICLINMRNRLSRILRDIYKNITNYDDVLVQIILSSEELKRFWINKKNVIYDSPIENEIFFDTQQDNNIPYVRATEAKSDERNTWRICIIC